MEIKNILVIPNMFKPDAKKVLKEIEQYFKSRKIAVHVYSYGKKGPLPDLKKMDLALCLGGDGTLLFTARMLLQKQIPIMGINLGDFGFVTEISQNEWKQAYEKYISGNLSLSRRIMIEAAVERNGKTLFKGQGLNEIVIGSCGISRLVKLQIFLSDTFIGHYRADGVILATPTGSTAYSMAAEGPILHPEMEAIILNPICPFTLSNRPIVMHGSENIRVLVEREQRTDLLLTIDGQETFDLKAEDILYIKKSPIKSLIINSDRRNFYEVLRSKLNWSGGPNA
ncbi:MAG: NAD(+)/NADH kinase [Spirochaetales bacterium]|nr:NAD(+)/NADH kinase [Spirochaetales bacterium]